MTTDTETIKQDDRHFVARIEELAAEADTGAGRLGRHIHFDARSLEFLIDDKLDHTGALPDKIWPRRLGTLDQGQLGACTEYGFVGTTHTQPLWSEIPTAKHKLLTNPVKLYEEETASDDIPGQYPPDDTGSTVLAAMKLGQSLGVITSYHWGTNHDAIATAIATFGPGEIGISWYAGFDRPDDRGVCTISGGVRGGHAIELQGRVTVGGEVFYVCHQSWGHGWPAKPFMGHDGLFAFTEADFRTLMADQGECAFPTVGA